MFNDYFKHFSHYQSKTALFKQIINQKNCKLFRFVRKILQGEITYIQLTQNESNGFSKRFSFLFSILSAWMPKIIFQFSLFEWKGNINKKLCSVQE